MNDQPIDVRPAEPKVDKRKRPRGKCIGWDGICFASATIDFEWAAAHGHRCSVCLGPETRRGRPLFQRGDRVQLLDTSAPRQRFGGVGTVIGCIKRNHLFSYTVQLPGQVRTQTFCELDLAYALDTADRSRPAPPEDIRVGAKFTGYRDERDAATHGLTYVARVARRTK